MLNGCSIECSYDDSMPEGTRLCECGELLQLETCRSGKAVDDVLGMVGRGNVHGGCENIGQKDTLPLGH